MNGGGDDDRPIRISDLDSRQQQEQQHDEDDYDDNDDDAEPFPESFLPLASPITRQILLVPFFFRGVVGAERRMRPWRRTMHRPPYRPLRGVLDRLIGGRIYHRALAL